MWRGMPGSATGAAEKCRLGPQAPSWPRINGWRPATKPANLAPKK